ncbi:WD40 repeat-like protein [Fistulina hepatica ATCC 64428]|uniref:WD40 repeat-like protein n=1 Tax=Fistulina hepatica ATCC 64428 TaxID=1128425 RepID=A0A0D7AN68_9AGAR|nr:WD40 repeat-like protein [Fistulina hepatica ATCC 64428]
MTTQTSVLQFEAPWPVYCVDWCKTPAPGQLQRPRSAFRLGISSFTEDFTNRIAIVGLQDESVLVEDDYDYSSSAYPDFVTLCEVHHGYPATCLQWQPASAGSYNWLTRTAATELLATTGDALRLWEYNSDAPPQMTQYIGRQPVHGHAMTTRAVLHGQSKVSPGQSQPKGAPLTNFSWNEKSPQLLVTSSIDTTCTVWNIDTQTAITQLIAHDREVYDVAWLPNSTDIFVSVGADGSLRAFDLRSLEHSTILYETPAPKSAPPPPSTSPNPTARPPSSPLLRIAFPCGDQNYMSTFHMDGSRVQILDIRNPGHPVLQLSAHHSQVNSVGWGSSQGHSLLATAADDCQLLLWDLNKFMQGGAETDHRGTGSRLSSPMPSNQKKKAIEVTDPVMAYTAQNPITYLAWSPQIPGVTMSTGHQTTPGEWIAISSGTSVRTLKV